MVLRLPWVPPKHRRCAQGLEIRVDSVHQNVEALGRCWGPRSQRTADRVGVPWAILKDAVFPLANQTGYIRLSIVFVVFLGHSMNLCAFTDILGWWILDFWRVTPAAKLKILVVCPSVVSTCFHIPNIPKGIRRCCLPAKGRWNHMELSNSWG